MCELLNTTFHLPDEENMDMKTFLVILLTRKQSYTGIELGQVLFSFLETRSFVQSSFPKFP